MKVYFLLFSLVVVHCYADDGAHKKRVKAPDKQAAVSKNYVSTFEEAIIAAYNTNKGWFASQTDKRTAEEALTQAKMMFLPSIQGRISSERNRDEVEQFTVRQTEKKTTTKMDISISQNLFNGFSTVSRISASESAAKAAYHKLKFEEQRLIIRVLDAYAGIWAGRQKVAALKKKEENLKKTAESKNASLEAGAGTPAEVAQASANHQRAIYERIEAETELFTSESEFEKLTGLRASEDMELPDLQLDLPKSLDELVAQAMSANHNIRSSRLEEQAEVSNLNATKGALSPSCDLSLRSGRNLTKRKYNDSQNTYTASIDVTVPIFSNSPSSGNTYSAIAIANQRALKAKFTAEDTMLEVKKECIVNWNKYISANAMIKASRSAVKSAELSSESNFEENTMGIKSNTEILDGENQLLDARVTYANSRKQKILAATTISALSGNLSLGSLFKKRRNI
ncbi:MAG: TolC family protein [Holosporaceae bacterium]|nr:TolC family protein [Holosporaceae bacterium]